MSEELHQAPESRPRTTPRWVVLGIVLLIMFIVPALLFLWVSPGHGPVNPNTATLTQLMTLREIRPEVADHILKRRPFTDEADFQKRVPEISPQLLEQIRTRLDFDGDGQGDCCVVH